MPEIPLEDADGDLQGRRARGFLHPARKKGHRTRDPTQSIPKACLFHATFRTHPLKHGRNASRTSRDPSKIPYLTAQFPFCVSINVQAEFGKPAP